MSKILNEVLLANRDYVSGFDKGGLAMPPARQFAILGDRKDSCENGH